MKTFPTSVPAAAEHFEVKGIQKGVFYQFWLTAHNALGEGKPSPIEGYRVQQPEVRTGGPPRLLSINQTVYVVRGGTAKLACKTLRGERGAKRRWMKGAEKEEVGRGGSDRIWSIQDELRLRSVELADGGNYTCVVENFGGAKTSVTYDLVVQGMELLIVETCMVYVNVFNQNIIWKNRRSRHSEDRDPNGQLA